MTLWTIQPIGVYENLIETGRYICDINKSGMSDLRCAYDWLVEQMISKIGAPPEGVKYPVWAWYKDGEKYKPDLRQARFAYGKKGEKFACIEIEIPDDMVVLSDFDDWHMILNDDLISFTEVECDQLQEEYDLLSESDKLKMKYDNWQRVFNVDFLENEWTRRGEYIQATFWELRKDQIKGVRFFTAG